MPKRSYFRPGRALAGAAVVVLAAAVGVIATADGARPTVTQPGFAAKTRVVAVRGHSMLLVVNITVTHIDRGATSKITCAHCRRLAGRVQVNREFGTHSLDGVNWLLGRRRAIRVSVTKPGFDGRFFVLGWGARPRLVLRASGCLNSRGRAQSCAAGGTAPTTTGAATTTPGAIASAATFDGSISPLAAQCAPNTPSKPPRLRGTYAFDDTIVGQGSSSLRITLPADPDLATYPLEACGLNSLPAPIGLGTDVYYGLMVYVPTGWTIPNTAFYGLNIYELHFQDIYGAPIMVQLHPHHVTLALETGGCDNHLTAHPSCAWRSNADAPQGSKPTLPGYYVIPPGRLAQGAWNEMVIHVRWSSGTDGQIQTYYRVKGASTWNQAGDVTGIPTVQWDNALGCCAPTAIDQVQAYTAGLSAPMSVWLDDAVDGTSLAAVEGALP